MMDQIVGCLTHAMNSLAMWEQGGVSKAVPFILFDFERFGPGQDFHFLPPYGQRFFGQTDDLGLYFERGVMIRVPRRIVDNFALYFPSIRHDGERFGQTTHVLDKTYLGLCRLDGEHLYMVSELSLIAHYNLMLVARHILSAASPLGAES